MALNEHVWKAFVELDARDYELRVEPGQPPYLAYWNAGKLGPAPTEEQIYARIAAYDAARQAEQDSRNASRNAARNAATFAVGKQFSNLTQPERTGLLAVLIDRAGGLNPDGTVRPFDAWEGGV